MLRPCCPAAICHKINPVTQGPVRNVVGTTSSAQWRNTALALGMGIACAARRRVQRVQRNATVQQWNARVRLSGKTWGLMWAWGTPWDTPKYAIYIGEKYGKP